MRLALPETAVAILAILAKGLKPRKPIGWLDDGWIKMQARPIFDDIGIPS
jgi:hypothetical protein